MSFLKEFLWIQSSLPQEKSYLPFCNRTVLKTASDFIRGFLIWAFHKLFMTVSLLKNAHLRMTEFCPKISMRKYQLSKTLKFHHTQTGATSSLDFLRTNDVYSVDVCFCLIKNLSPS